MAKLSKKLTFLSTFLFSSGEEWALLRLWLATASPKAASEAVSSPQGDGSER